MVRVTMTAEQRQQARQKSEASRERRRDPEAVVDSIHRYISANAKKQIIARVKSMPLSSRLTYAKAMRGNSLAAGVKAFCQMCMGWQDARRGIRNCTDTACPLHPYRPYVDDHDED